MERFEQISPELKRLLGKAEEMDWSYDVWIEPTQNNRVYAELGKYSPAGEDFSMIVDFDIENQAVTFIDDLRSCYENFDPDEHAEMWIPSRGKGGCPSSIRRLIEDADAIDEMIKELLDALESMPKIKGIVVGRHIEGITLNPIEYLLDDEGDLMTFESEEEAKEYLKEEGFSDDDIYWMVFEEV